MSSNYWKIQWEIGYSPDLPTNHKPVVTAESAVKVSTICHSLFQKAEE